MYARSAQDMKLAGIVLLSVASIATPSRGPAGGGCERVLRVDDPVQIDELARKYLARERASQLIVAPRKR